MSKKSKAEHHQHHHAHPHHENHQHHPAEQAHYQVHHNPMATGKMLEEKILDNLIVLQKVHTSVAEKFDSLSRQLSQLLNLFEITAKSFASNPVNMVTERDKDFLEKIDRLLEQNKIIAKGLTLMEERIRERVTTGNVSNPIPRPQIYQPQAYQPQFSQPAPQPMIPQQQPFAPPTAGPPSQKDDEYEPSLNRPLPKF